MLPGTFIAQLWASLVVYWGAWHIIRQHYGFQRMYERKAGGVAPRESWGYARVLEAVSYLPLLIRFRSPALMTLHAGGVNTWIRHPEIPRPLWLGFAGLYGAVLLAAIAHHGWMAARGRTQLMPRALQSAKPCHSIWIGPSAIATCAPTP